MNAHTVGAFVESIHRPSVVLVERDTFREYVAAVPQMVEDLRLRRKVVGRATQPPGDIAGGEELIRLMKSDIGIRVVPHSTRVRTAVDEDHPSTRVEVFGGHGERIQARYSRADDAEVDVHYRSGTVL